MLKISLWLFFLLIFISCAPRKPKVVNIIPDSFKRWKNSLKTPPDFIVKGKVISDGEEGEFDFELRKRDGVWKIGLFGPLGVNLGIVTIDDERVIYEREDKLLVFSLEELGVKTIFDILNGHFNLKGRYETHLRGRDTLFIVEEDSSLIIFNFRGGKLKKLEWNSQNMRVTFLDFIEENPPIPREIKVRGRERFRIFIRDFRYVE